MVTKAQVLGADVDTEIALVDDWKVSAQAMADNADTYVRFVTFPGGSDWSGLTRDAMVTMVGQDRVAIVNAKAVIDAMAAKARLALDTTVRANLKAAVEEITAASTGPDPATGTVWNFQVHDDLTVTDPNALATFMLANNERRDALERFQLSVPRLAKTWWDSAQTVADQVRTDKIALSTVFGTPAATDAPAAQVRSGDLPAIDAANRVLLFELEAEYQQLPEGQIKTDRLADIAGIRAALDVPGSSLLLLQRPDDPSQMVRAATVVGDPFTADHVSVTVPGVSSTTRGSLKSMTREAELLQKEAMKIANRANASLGPGEVPVSGDVATVAWMGYQPPLAILSGDTPSDALAQRGAADLTSFLRDIDAAASSPDTTVALLGHSYGSLTSGIALASGAAAVVDNAVLYGSPGLQAGSAAELGMSNDNVFVMTTPDDYLARPVAALAPTHGWGPDPNDVLNDSPARSRFPHLYPGPAEYRIPQLYTGEGDIPGYGHKDAAHGHSEYPRDAQTRMTGYNLAAVVLDRPDLAVHLELSGPVFPQGLR